MTRSASRSLENITHNLGGYGIYAEVIGDEEISVTEYDSVAVAVRRQGFEFLAEEGFERDEEKTRKRGRGAVYHRPSAEEADR